ncbi:MAG: glycolate oxidase subunit GlcE [Proteobacteria bacterium]|nr:glycolate oxidase subunit GlcE [Pseudomonadota bacterium]
MQQPTELADRIKAASSAGQVLQIRGGGSKDFLGHAAGADSEVLDTRCWQGVIEYHPDELVLRARAGTSLEEILALLAEHRQMLPFEPPQYPGATLGGVVATGLSGSRRPYAGAVRDHVLGVGLILHDGTYAEFGGQVMKNVAGYDVSRLVCGSYGMLGVIADVSLKVLPAPAAEQSCSLEMDETAARDQVYQLTRKVSPLSASCYLQGRLHLRLSGSDQVVQDVLQQLGGQPLDPGFWRALDCHELPYFTDADEIWRYSTDAEEQLDGLAAGIQDWGFAQRWFTGVRPDQPGAQGHWYCWKTNRDGVERFPPLPDGVMNLQQRLKKVFDPQGIFNPGRMYPAL